MSSETVQMRTSPPTFAYLIVTKGAQAGSIYQLKADTTSVGRSGTNGIRIDDSNVSSEHLRIRCENGEFTLVDLGSTNGTRINGRQMHQHVLRHNDRVQIGETVLLFKKV